MSSPLRASIYRTALGGLLAVAAVASAFLLLPDASQERMQKSKAAQEAAAAWDRQRLELGELQVLEDQISQSRDRMQKLMASLPTEDPGRLQWKLSGVLHELARKHGIRLQSVKYGSPSREGTKGSGLEVMEAEFTIIGVYTSIKPFMLALEGSDLPFALSTVRLDESPEGARLTAVLRSFRQSGAAKQSSPAEEAQ